jgi:lactate dehydrogenase-like 2-hydroxyacid dehydrogenase
MGALPTPKGTKKPKVSSKSPAKSSAKTKTKGSPPTPKVAAKPVKSDPEVDELKQLFATEGTGNVEETPSVATVMPGIAEVPEVAEPPAEPVVAVKADVAMAPAVEQPMEPTAAPAVAEPQAPVMALDADVAMAPAVEQSMEPAAAPAAAEPQAPDDSKDSFGCRLPLEPFVAAATAEELESQRALALCMALNRCMGPAHQRVKKYNFAIEGCEGFDMQIVTVGVIGDDFGDGTASACSVAYFAALSCSIVTAGPQDDLSTVLACNIVCAHLDGEDAFFAAERLSQLKEGAMLIVANAKSLDIPAVVAALDAGKLGYLGVGALDDSAVPEFTPLCARPNVLVAPLVAKGAVSSAAIPSGMSAAGATETLVAGSEAPDAVRVACFSSRSYFSTRFAEAVSSASPKEIRFEMHSARLDQTSAQLAAGCKAVCLFVNDTASADVLSTLHELGIEVILMRCAGFDKVDVAAAGALGIKVARVPAYSPDAVAQHAVSLLLTLKWKLAAPAAGPLGLNFKATTIGVLGTGRIGCLCAPACHRHRSQGIRPSPAHDDTASITYPPPYPRTLKARPVYPRGPLH